MKILITVLCIFVLAETHEIKVNENDDFDIKCEETEGIFIESATWRRDRTSVLNYIWNPNWRNFVFPPLADKLGMCTYNDTTNVKNLCHGHQECKFKVDRTHLGNECNSWMVLEVSYRCDPCNSRSKRSNVRVDFCLDLTRRLGGKSNNLCPNSWFEEKHVCTSARTCHDSELSAFGFAMQTANLRRYGATSSTTFNSVFIAPSVGYNYANGQCQFDRYVPKYNCQLTNGHWSCVREAYNVMASHDINTGHYNQHLDVQQPNYGG